ncbi:MAG: hypothetical protein AAF845_01065 [Bacteroidota bacterium]
MPQTLLALLALSLASLLSLNMQRAQIHSTQNRTGHEIELLASAAGSYTIDLLEAQAFDRATVPSAISATTRDELRAAVDNLDASDFAPASTFGLSTSGECDIDQLWADTVDCDDIDDFHGIDRQRVELAMGRTNDKYPFDVSVNVRYVAGALGGLDAASTERTSHKELTVDIYEARPVGAPVDNALAPIATLKRIISLDRGKIIRDYIRDRGDTITDLEEDNDVLDQDGDDDEEEDYDEEEDDDEDDD